MRRFISQSRTSRNHRGVAELSYRDIRAIREAIANAPTPGMRAELEAVANRQHVHLY